MTYNQHKEYIQKEFAKFCHKWYKPEGAMVIIKHSNSKQCSVLHEYRNEKGVVVYDNAEVMLKNHKNDTSDPNSEHWQE